MKWLAFDTESDGFKHECTQLWCINAIDDAGNEYAFSPENLQDGLELLTSAPVLIAHNALGHDLPILSKLFKWQPSESQEVYDTFILSNLVEPDRKNGHSLEGWGKKWGILKVENEDWSRHTPLMSMRCRVDANITGKVWEYLIDKIGEHDWEDSIVMEHDIARIHAQQELNGVLLDKKLARSTLKRLKKRRKVLNKKINKGLPPIVKHTWRVQKPYKGNGDYSASSIKLFGDDIDRVAGLYSRVEFEPMNSNSAPQIKKYLLSQGWIPTEYNTKKEYISGKGMRSIRMSPKLTEDSYGSLTTELPLQVAERSIVEKRMQCLKWTTATGRETGWLNTVRTDGRVTAGGVPLGTPTARYRHTGIVNVVKHNDKTLHSKGIRQCLTVPKGYRMLGCDAVALEARVEGHYLYSYDEGKRVKSLLSGGDVHQANADAYSAACGTTISRSKGKNGTYALMYGSGADTLAATLGVAKRYGNDLLEAFWSVNLELAELKEATQREFAQRGNWIRGIDGRKLFPRSPHSCLNMLFQSAGSIIVKRAMIIMDNEITEQGLDSPLIIQSHDEIQREVLDDDRTIKAVTEICLNAFNESGKYYNTNIRFDGDVMIGNNWSETH